MFCAWLSLVGTLRAVPRKVTPVSLVLKVVTRSQESERRRTMLLLVVAAVALTLSACSPTARPPGVAAKPTSTTAVAVRRGPPPLNSHCSRARIELSDGALVPAQYLAAIQFLSADTAIGLTAASISCSIGRGGGSAEPFPVFEVVSTDGGRTWRTTGSRLPRSLDPGFADADLAFSTTSEGYVEASGTLGFTSDEGRRWHLLDLGGTITALEAARPGIVALVSNPGRHETGAVLLSATGSATSSTPMIRAPGFLVATIDEFAVVPTTGELVVVVPAGKGYYLVTARRFGSPWSRLTMPCPGLRVGAVLATSSGGLVAICAVGAGMNKSPKVVAVSSDGGRTWRRVASWLGPQAPDRSGIPIADFLTASVGSGDQLYLATTTEAASSSDGGQHWSPLDIGPRGKYLPDDGSYGAEFDFVGRVHGWLLLQGEALLSTTDGEHWQVLAGSSPKP